MRSGVSDISERGVIIKHSERGGEIVDAPLRSYTLIGHRHTNLSTHTVIKIKTFKSQTFSS